MQVYQSLFPLGEPGKYAHLVFNSIDKQRTGGITFGDFMAFLSTLSKGSARDKMLWTFHFYDVNSDGCISRDEMMKVVVVVVVVEMLVGVVLAVVVVVAVVVDDALGDGLYLRAGGGDRSEAAGQAGECGAGVRGLHRPSDRDQLPAQVFSTMDTNRDGVVSEEEFLAYCSSNHVYAANLSILP